MAFNNRSGCFLFISSQGGGLAESRLKATGLPMHNEKSTRDDPDIPMDWKKLPKKAIYIHVS